MAIVDILPRGRKRRTVKIANRHADMRLCVVLVVALCFVSACTASPRLKARALAQQHGFTERLFVTRPFVLFGLYHPGISPQPKTLRVYIEGDGHAWESRTRPASDPTPHNPVALDLATADPGTDPVLYLARPCQYVQGEDWRHCTKRYWTTARLGQDVIASLDAAITQAKAICGAEQVILVGFSGGGGAAVLLAAKRQDVAFLGTIAGNLDTDAWTQLQGVSPLAESLNPMTVAASLQRLPQLHLSSHADTIIPPEISAKFCRATGQPQSCVVVNDVGHGGSWQAYWGYDYQFEK
jgi:poly(3-hydroxybutyrate) depolymerase